MPTLQRTVATADLATLLDELAASGAIDVSHRPDAVSLDADGLVSHPRHEVVATVPDAVEPAAELAPDHATA